MVGGGLCQDGRLVHATVQASVSGIMEWIVREER